MATTTAPRLLALGFAGLGLTAALAGCSTAATVDSGGGSDTAVDDTADTSAEYADGVYTAEGDYTSPAGPSKVTVEITIENDTIAAVTVTPLATDPTSKGFQTQFADGIADVVIGQDIDTLDVSRVGGSSLTSGGFNDAIAQIKAEALVS
ncbi:hypothetical protein [Pseudolysinimonas sp.]|jgi:uncharacterized protein with FMN-binding domain|uniref:hypothetical protein n=1 Tax=Pseudolysinimonas sp. TaxID=2680009 RepID=UPI003783BF63